MSNSTNFRYILSIYTLCSLATLFQLIGCTTKKKDWLITLPGVQATSSPRVADLTGDGVNDIILGGGGPEWAHSDSAVLAFDGQDGHLLWHTPGRNQVFGSATFLDINRDQTPDVIIGGRSAELQAIDGKTGHLIWEFFTATDSMAHKRAGWFNFTNGQLIPDQDADGLDDLLIANGGDATIMDTKSPRPVGRLLLLSTRTGHILHQARVPDGKETYCSPVISKRGSDPAQWLVLFGTGGEAIGGCLYKATLGDLFHDNLANAKLLVTEAKKGIVAPPLVCDLNRDGTPDYLVTTVAARTLAIDGKTDRVLWTFSAPGAETYSMPAVGYFTGNDSIPDFFVSYAVGTYPVYGRGIQFLLDGATGRPVHEYATMGFSYGSPLTLDMNDDGFDDVVLNVNEDDDPHGPRSKVESKLIGFDFRNNSQSRISDALPGANFAITPYIGDLDNDGSVDVLYGSLGATSVNYPGVDVMRPLPAPVTYFARRSLSGLPAKTVRWGAYMGEKGDACFTN
ncbi:outer membrane protein assembly factor BamB family protein [Fibrella aestuarina]|nr:PQQ-binding-like beta-propeller repeat protein [Fibrella aestuarina]